MANTESRKSLFSITPPPIPVIEVSAWRNGGVLITIADGVCCLNAIEVARLGRVLTTNAAGTTTMHDLPALGSPLAGGFFGGVSRDGTWIIVSSRADGEAVLAWKTTRTASLGARSFSDGLANTRVIADEDHPAAAHCAALRIGGHEDWHLGSLDDMQTLARNLMPRDGGNPEQTMAEPFKTGGAEAFAEEWYWTSAEQSPGCAWVQYFGNGDQSYFTKESRLRVRAVRKIIPFTA